MRRLFFPVVLGLVVTAGFAQAAGPKDYAKGSGATSVAGEFSFNASSDPAGGSPSGTMRWTFESATGQQVEVVADVTCLTTLGNPLTAGGSAMIAGDVVKMTPSDASAMDGLIFSVHDSGQPQGQGDRFGAALSAESLPERACGDFGALATNTLTNGNITVIDE